ncbi:NADPH oxidase 5-like [Anneissia japonica]|uniref:NADPH oxidase 5-like n=1 Tax=Anneissia japonica TaxID=1529436 RepID=UPI0014258FC3|nr:NADPH oxidase 5-like [Anneissia japonica]
MTHESMPLVFVGGLCCNGTIEYDELHTVLKSCMAESAIQLSDETLHELTSVLFHEADEDDSGSITFDELQNQLTKYPDITENLTVSAASWMHPPVNQHWTSIIWNCSAKRFSRAYIRNNLPLLAFAIIYVFLNTALFCEANVKTRRTNVGYFWLSIAKGCGACLNLNGTILLFLMLRKFLTLLRGTLLSHYLPIDQHILLHKTVACVIILLSTIHTISHIIHFLEMSKEGNTSLSAVEHFLTVKSRIGWIAGTANVTGMLLLVLLIVISTSSVSLVRRKGYFQVFYWTHQLSLLWWLLLMVHAQKFWMWFVIPGVLYVIERVLRMKLVRKAKFGRIFINQAVVLPDKVLHLVIPRPNNFSFQAGEYVYINIPSIAHHEWHPFTISSAPEQQRKYSILINFITGTPSLKNDGCKEINETNQKFSKAKTPKKLQRRRVTQHSLDVVLDGVSSSGTDIEVYIDGPYGAPSQHIFQAEHAVLIGAGIGVTPFASILQSIHERYKVAKRICPNCKYAWMEDTSSIMRLKKVDFMWINRDQRSFEWFISLLNQIEIEQQIIEPTNRFLNMHLYMTSALRMNDVKAIGLQMALDLLHKKSNRDTITGLMTRTQPGRPDWNKVFTNIRNARQGKVTVFFSGVPELGDVICKKSSQFGFDFRKENF